ncbi:hypothetical protein APTSU1_000155100 [Apodemus speciosus]|uniref:Uncharacterized protein n=1 Tax=Apodemus speciosus TaxID=105296 RepID=A0ABQ0EHP5_APOSI
MSARSRTPSLSTVPLDIRHITLLELTLAMFVPVSLQK